MTVPTDERPIGVFDSGVGGLSVLRAIRDMLPNEALIYVADSAHAPYGDRDASTITERALALSTFLVDSGVKAIVVACNTATVVAVDALRARFDLPIIALEPAIKPAATLSRSGVVAVLATSRTLQSRSVRRLCEHHAGTVRVLLQPCPGLVERVESGAFDDDETLRLLESYVRPVIDAGADTIVLGCTHYPFLAQQIRALAGESVVLLDSADAVARQVRRRVTPARPLARGEIASTSCFTTGDPEQAAIMFSRLWGSPVAVRAVSTAADHDKAPGSAFP